MDRYNTRHDLDIYRWKAACAAADKLPTRCSCRKSRPKELYRAEGTSDSLLITYKCMTCGVKYARYIEG